MAKLKLTVTITPETIKRVDDQIRKGRFADRRHAVQYSLLQIKELLERGEIKF